MLVNREHSINVIGEVTSARFAHFQEKRMTKELHAHLTAFAAAGTGKSRLIQEGVALLRQADLPPELGQALRTEGGSVAVHASFNGDTKFCEFDKKNMGAALAARLLASYFGCQWSSVQTLPIYHQLSTAAAIKCIVLDHRARHHLTHDQLVLLYVAVDDVGATLMEDAPSEWSREERAQYNRKYLKDVSNDVGAVLLQPPDQATFTVSILTGTTTKALQEVMNIDSSHPYRQLAVPLLSFEQCLQILRHLGWEDWANSRECQQLLADLGGIPRLVDFLCGMIKMEIDAARDPESANWLKIRKAVTNEAHRRYRTPDNAALVKAVVKAALTRVPVRQDAVIAGVTWEVLQRGGHIVLDDTGTGENLFTVAVPYMILRHHVQNHLSQLPSAASFLFDMPAAEFFEWQTWEKFVVMYDAMLASLHASDGPRSIAVGEFYRGALVHPDIAGLQFHVVGDVEYVACKEQFPKTSPPHFRSRPHDEIAWEGGGYAVLNAAGACSIDGFSGNPKDPGGTVLRCTQGKSLQDLGAVITLQNIEDICSKVDSGCRCCNYGYGCSSASCLLFVRSLS